MTLVERLQELWELSDDHGLLPNTGIDLLPARDAINEITRLTAENEKLRSRSITLRTERNGSTAGQRIIVSVHDGEHEWDVIEEFGALPDISIHHSVTPFGIEERRAKSIVGETARTALEQP